LPGVYYGAIEEQPEDTCPKCGTVEANQVLRVDKLALFYQCRHCAHEWTPPIKLGKTTVWVRKSNTSPWEILGEMR